MAPPDEDPPIEADEDQSEGVAIPGMGQADEPDDRGDQTDSPDAGSPDKSPALTLAGLGEAFSSVLSAMLGKKRQAEPAAEQAPRAAPPGETEVIVPLSPDLPDAEDVDPEFDPEDAGVDEGATPASRPLVSSKGMLEAFKAMFGGRGPGSDEATGPAPREQKPGLLGRFASWGRPASGPAPAQTPKAFGPPARGQDSPLPSLAEALGDTGALGREAREAAGAMLLGAPVAFVGLEVATGWPPPGKRPMHGPFWSRQPAWLAATADASATLRWPAAALDAGTAEVTLGQASWTRARRGPVHVYAMGAQHVKEDLRRQWHREAYLAVGQSLDAALADAYERELAPRGDRWGTAQALLGGLLGKQVRLTGRAGLFGLGKHSPEEEGTLDSSGAQSLLAHFTAPATLHMVLRHVRRTRAAALAALVPAESRLDLGWPGLPEGEFPMVDGEFVAPRASLGEARATLHPQRDLVTATGGAAWRRGDDEGEAGWMLRLAVETIVRRERWLDLLEREAGAAWNAIAGLAGAPRMVFEGQRRWPWTESLIAQAGGEGRSDLAALADQVLGSLDLSSHATDGAQRPFGAHARDTIRRTLLLS